MSASITYNGPINQLDMTATSMAVIVPQTDPAMIAKFGPVLVCAVDLNPGDKLPYHLALASMLRDACINNRKVEMVLTLIFAMDPMSVPPGMPVPIDINYPYVFGRHQCVWVCERVSVKNTE